MNINIIINIAIKIFQIIEIITIFLKQILNKHLYTYWYKKQNIKINI